MIIRNLDPLGRVVIPKEIRRMLGIEEGGPVEISVKGNTLIIIKKFEEKCVFCNASEATLKNFFDKKICEECLEVVKGID